MFAIPRAPAKQSVSETISVLSGRLTSATLLEDRRAAILGLRSFAKDYPATVASGALRSLIGSLSKDGEDVDTVKVVLETLLMLFNPNQESPEASDEVVLWLADEFTQRQDNITLLLDFLDSFDFYSRLYSLQLLTAILSARTERTEECIFTAPLGIPRLVTILDDQRDAIRSEATTLLTYLTSSSTDVQKLVAFENAFERLFSIIASDGNLSDGSQIVEDCLILLANLLRGNPSNQSLFRESRGIPRLSQLLQDALEARGDEADVIAAWAEAQRNRNIFALLALVRLLLVEGAVGTSQNQTALWQHGLLYHALQLSFSRVAQTPIRAEALVTCADIIRGNASLQENFAQLQVPQPLVSLSTKAGHEQTNGTETMVYVIDGLLDLALSMFSLDAFDVRRAASDCLKSYFFKHTDIRLHFLKRAIEGHKSGIDETTNVLTVLLRLDPENAVGNPYRSWFAAILMFHLLFDNPEAKSLMKSLTEGDADNGEEVVTAIQIIAAHLVASLNRELDRRVVTGYLLLLLGWMFEDLDAVDDFLGEGSNTQSLIQVVTRQGPADDILQGLSAMLLGEIYEFSTKDSPISRATLHSILLSRMGRERYVDKLSKLRCQPLMRDFEVLPQKLDPSTGLLPEVFFDATFVDFFKDNYSRFMRAIDREPGMEVSVLSNGVQRGISRELVDTLRAQAEEKEKMLQDAQVALAALERQLGQEQADHRRSREQGLKDLDQARTDRDALRREHESEIDTLRDKIVELQREHQGKMQQARKSAEAEQEDLRRQHVSKQEDLQRQIEYLKKTGDAELEQVDIVEKRSHMGLTRYSKLRRNNKTAQECHEKQLSDVKKTGEAESDRLKRRAEADAADFRATISRLEVDLMKANKSKAQELQAVREEYSGKERQQRNEHTLELEKQKSAAGEVTSLTKELERKLQDSAQRLLESKSEKAKFESSLQASKEALKSTQSELDDLLMVFSDMEDKVAKYKARLKAKGEQVSDDDEDEDEDDNSSEDGEDEGKEDKK